MSKNQLVIDKLDHYKRYNKKLTCRWDAGGDETIIQFQLDGKKMSYGGERNLLSTLYDWISTTLDLPNAGEYYNHGNGTIYLNEKNQVLIQYDEIAYGEMEDDVTKSDQNLLLEHSFPSFQKRKKPVIINGTIDLDSHLLEDDFDFYCKEEPAIIPRAEKKQIEGFIIKELSKTLVWDRSNTSVHFHGSIENNLMCIEEIYLTKYNIDKNNLKKITVLL